MRHFYSLVLMLFLAASVQAQTTIWLGGSTDWEDPTNWSDGVPSSGGTATLLEMILSKITSTQQVWLGLTNNNNGNNYPRV